MMFRSTYLLIGLFILGSCSDNSDTAIQESENQTLRLNLIKMSGNTLNSEKSGSDMAWQEYYELKNEMRFTKVQIREGDTLQSQGNFDIVMIESDKYLKFTHDSEHKIIANCTGTTEELLEYTASNSLESNWEDCRGSSLYYQFEN
ncbi:hypothetical protein QO206_08985 [Leeuwenhoekiella aequorea]|uniref:hypothetical protein n=1 Tax=Leeuwenhoekiella aequorea TaxID=283736 RepID=UPI00352D75C2